MDPDSEWRWERGGSLVTSHVAGYIGPFTPDPIMKRIRRMKLSSLHPYSFNIRTYLFHIVII